MRKKYLQMQDGGMFPILRELLAALAGVVVGITVLSVGFGLQFNNQIFTLLLVSIITPSSGALAYCLVCSMGLKSTSGQSKTGGSP